MDEKIPEGSLEPKKEVTFVPSFPGQRQQAGLQALALVYQAQLGADVFLR
jgi:hypothetical protein